MTPTLWLIAAYMAVQLGIGIWVSRRIHTEADYLIAGRRLGYSLATFSIFATWFGAETIIGSSGTVYSEGVSFASAEPFGYGLCLVLMGLVFAVPLWRRKLTTLADLFRQRFSPTVERVAAIILIPSSILWAAAQVRAFGHVVSAASAIELEVAIGVAAAATIAYTVVGGLMVDAITDLIQGTILIIGLFAIGLMTVVTLGGPADAVDAIRVSGALAAGQAARPGLLESIEAWAIPVCGSVLATELVGRVIATRSPEVARRSSIAAGGIYLVVGTIPVFVGLAGVGMGLELADPEQLMPVVAASILPTLAYAVFAGGLISAILSTVDSTLLIASGLLSHNLIVPALRSPDERTKVRIARGGVLAFGVVAYVLALRAEGVFALVEQASAFGSAGTLGAVSFGLFTGFGGARTALATLLVGILAYFSGLLLGFPYPFLLSLAASLATYVVGGLGGGIRAVRSTAR